MLSRLTKLTVFCLVVLLEAGCGDAESTRHSLHLPVVYGEDDRRDVYDYFDESWAQEVSGFTVALMTADTINVSGEGEIAFDADTLEIGWGVCPDERFSQQLTAAFCSGTLIASDLVMTAGHCVPDASTCANTHLVFGYQMDGPDQLHPVTEADLFSCAELLVHEFHPAGIDFAILRLDRSAGREPARLSPGRATVAVGTPLLVHGYPTGLPTKIDDGGHVRDERAAERDYFIANLDTFGGSSGAGVFESTSKNLVGILVRGEVDYVFDPGSGCYRVNQCPEDGCLGEHVVYGFQAIDALCETGLDTPLCPCGDGVCDAMADESTATCPTDCGTACGDGVCNGAEAPIDCPEDCGTCGNAICDDGEDQFTCCTDCSCSTAALQCTNNACVPDPTAGDTCDEAAALQVVGAYVVQGSTVDAGDDYTGGCALNSDAPERVYSMTFAEETWLDARASGFDTALYVRTDCDNPISETVCVDDSSPPGGGGARIRGVFQPGTHYLFVDGGSTEAGTYDLDIEFTPVQLAPNDTCQAPSDIPAFGTQVVTTELSLISGRDDYQGSCGGDGADHVYRFTTDRTTSVSASVEGLDSVLYLRSDCSSPELAHEISCNDDDLEEGRLGSFVSVPDLPRGTYYLVVDSYSAGVIGEYTLTLAFEACPDIDDDGVCDSVDDCPSDPAKIEPGQCGCNVPDTDEDDDGSASCVDTCPEDGGKAEPGQCGCGTRDTDSDGDGHADCIDECPEDGNKVEPGLCGCGAPDIDSDGDGFADCVDLCSSDRDKQEPGLCGCGVDDIDSDDDGLADCDDGCPRDSDKREPGQCGCGVTEGSCGQGAASNGGCTIGAGDAGTGRWGWFVLFIVGVLGEFWRTKGDARRRWSRGSEAKRIYSC